MDMTTTNDTPATYGTKRAPTSTVIPWEARLALSRLLGAVDNSRRCTADAGRKAALERIQEAAADLDRIMGNPHRAMERPDHCLDQEYLEHLYLNGQ